MVRVVPRRLPAPRFRFVGLLLALLVAAIGLTFAASGDAVLPGDVAVARGVQGSDLPGARVLAVIAYVLGATPVVTALGLALTVAMARAGRRAEVVFLATVLVVRGGNWLLKALAESPRPAAYHVRVTEEASGLGFPSSHVISAVLLYGAVICLSCRVVRPRTARIALVTVAVAAILVTGFGRVYTGAHWPSDVLGGYLWGIVLLLALRWGYHAVHRRWQPTPLIAGRQPA
jgi:undecaprenyl-diphosphatase